MGIFSRMADIINSNLNALLDKAEDPQKLIQLIIQEMEDTLVEVRSSSVKVLADRKTAKRRILQLQKNVDEWDNKARIAVQKGREDLARAALYEKQTQADEIRTIETELAALDEHIEQLDKEIEQLQQKLNDARAKQKTLSMRSKTVESRLKVKTQINRDSITDAFARYEGMERRMDRLEGQIDSMDLGKGAGGDVQSQFDALLNNDKINDELSRLKLELSADNANKG
ncbi:MAG: phage shock protein PspA [Gammaproteobacteria bacterium]|nr:phage shock protein PspA [Gammaproteobacteria bacterium]